ncbi:hypothetical protein HYW46_03125 [Candidatus Daviesbacteria bacterium]|nr:hypothetical protein [Candidatus Daviesbacteria bacterium]
MKLPIRAKHQNIRKAYQDKIDERESWHKLVVKIINWKDSVSRETSKITPKEWITYCHRMIKTNISYGKQKTQKNLNNTKELIKSHDGFEQELP